MSTDLSPKSKERYTTVDNRSTASTNCTHVSNTIYEHYKFENLIMLTIVQTSFLLNKELPSAVDRRRCRLCEHVCTAYRNISFSEVMRSDNFVFLEHPIIEKNTSGYLEASSNGKS